MCEWLSLTWVIKFNRPFSNSGQYVLKERRVYYKVVQVQNTGLVVNYGISNTFVLEIP